MVAEPREVSIAGKVDDDGVVRLDLASVREVVQEAKTTAAPERFYPVNRAARRAAARDREAKHAAALARMKQRFRDES